MASAPAPNGCRGWLLWMAAWLHIVVAWRDLPTPRLVGLALGKRMYLAGSCCPSSSTDTGLSIPAAKPDIRFRHSFPSCLPGRYLASVVQDAHSLIYTVDSTCLFRSATSLPPPRCLLARHLSAIAVHGCPFFFVDLPGPPQ
jgi:hypothetical protein